MKQFLFFIAVLIQTSVTFSQNWNCFPLNQQTWYESNAIPEAAIVLIAHDSVDMNGTQLFKKKLFLPAADSCRDNVYGLTNYYYPDYFYLDSLTTSGDTVIYNQHGTSVFFPSAQPGFSWNARAGVIMECDSVVVENVFGLSDSVKYFHQHGTTIPQAIRLSKRFGFLSFIPFDQTGSPAPAIFNIIGLADSSMQTGFQPPQFLDYFPYNAGDVILWEMYAYGGFWFPSYREYYRDSITNVSIYPDSVIIHYDQVYINQNNVIYSNSNLSKVYTYADFGFLLESVPSHFGVSKVHLFGNQDFGVYYTSPLKRIPDTVLTGTGIERRFNVSGLLIDSNCTIIQTVDGIYDQWRFNTILGHVEKKHLSSTDDRTWTYSVIGARMNGNVYGDADLHVGLNDLSIARVNIFPNPASDYCFIEQEHQVFSMVEVFDFSGRMVFSQHIFTGRNRLNMNDISSGIYTLRFRGEEISEMKLIKY